MVKKSLITFLPHHVFCYFLCPNTILSASFLAFKPPPTPQKLCRTINYATTASFYTFLNGGLLNYLTSILCELLLESNCRTNRGAQLFKTFKFFS